MHILTIHAFVAHVYMRVACTLVRKSGCEIYNSKFCKAHLQWAYVCPVDLLEGIVRIGKICMHSVAFGSLSVLHTRIIMCVKNHRVNGLR